MKGSMLVRIGTAARVQGEAASTLRRWEKEERMIPECRTRGGHRRYKLSTLNGERGEETIPTPRILGYARVSGTK